MNPLQIIGQIEIPAAVLTHRFVREALTSVAVVADSDEEGYRVVGTANTKLVELYGWGKDVTPHCDSTGYVYLVALNPGTTRLYAWEEVPGADSECEDDEQLCVELEAGTVVRLDDNYVHWTEDSGHRVCAFLGSFFEPCDAQALAQLEAGITALASGTYYGAPRVQEGFRALQADECLVPDAEWVSCAPMLLADAQAQGKHIEPCGGCTRPAVRLDDKWPFFSDRNRCADHLVPA